jgi:7-cyano-7-deazaguanine synthase
MLNSSAALVLFSGGQDSTTCLAWALDRFESVETIGFDYGQRHAVELSCRKVLRDELRRIKPEWERRLGQDRVLDASILGSLSTTALTTDTAITTGGEGLPTTFVPGRNVFFLTLAAVVAYQWNIKHIVLGVCETDYSGYPDCRDDTIKAMQLALNGAMARQFVIHTPLMWIDKKSTFDLAHRLGGPTLVDTVIEHTHTCYRGDRSHRHEWGYGCDDCPACSLRKEGYVRWRAASRQAL